MSFQKIIKSMERLDRQHERINIKFSTLNKNNYVYKNCLEEDQIEDLRVYGYTHKDTILRYQQKHRNSMDSLKTTSTTFISNPQRVKSAKNIKTIPRSQTAHHATRAKQSKLLLNYTVDQIHTKSLIHKNSLFFLNNLQQFNISGNSLKTSKKNQIITKKSIKKYKKQFSSAFEEDLKAAKLLSCPTKLKQKAKTLIIQNHRNQKQKNIKMNQNNFFCLTQQKNNSQTPTELISKTQNTTNQHKIINQLNLLIFQNFTPIFCNSKNKSWTELFKNFLHLKIHIYLVTTTDLSVYTINIQNIPKIQQILSTILKRQKIVHLNILLQKQDKNIQIIYQQFIISQCFSMQHHEWPKHLFRYFFRRFMLLSKQKQTIVQVNEQQKIFYQNYNKISKNFYRFIHELKDKAYILVDFKMNRTYGKLGIILQQGFKQMQLRRLNWNRKGTAFENLQNKLNKTKKYVYFYICSFLYNADLNITYQTLIKSFSYYQSIKSIFFIRADIIVNLISFISKIFYYFYYNSNQLYFVFRLFKKVLIFIRLYIVDFFQDSANQSIQLNFQVNIFLLLLRYYFENCVVI